MGWILEIPSRLKTVILTPSKSFIFSAIQRGAHNDYYVNFFKSLEDKIPSTDEGGDSV